MINLITLKTCHDSSVLCSMKTLIRVVDNASFPGNHLEGQGQNILEREDERVKRRRVNEKNTHIKGCFEGLMEPSCKVSKDCSSENNVAKSSLEGHRHLDSFPSTSSGRKLGRDDDENLVNSTQLNSRDKISSTPPDMQKLKYASSLMSGMCWNSYQVSHHFIVFPSVKQEIYIDAYIHDC